MLSDKDQGVRAIAASGTGALAVPVETAAQSRPSGLRSPIAMPATLDGHWLTLDGLSVAIEYASKQRSELCMGHMSDFELANRQFMASRQDFDLIAFQQAAKERIRWLSAHLAAANAAEAEQRRQRDLFFDALKGLNSWLGGLAETDLEEIVADGGITAGMVVVQEAAEQQRRVRAIIAEGC